MSKNLIPEIAHLLGVEVGEEFKVGKQPNIFKFSDNDFEFFDTYYDKWLPTSRDTLVCLLNGKAKIVKLPWKPKYGEKFFTYIGTEFTIVDCTWHEFATQYSLLKNGCIFHTEAEAIKERPRIYKELTGKELQE